MKKSFLIARSNVRKAKGQTVALIVLILIAAMMMNLWLMLSTDYRQNFDRYHDRLNAEHVTLGLYSNNDGLREYIAEILENDSHVTQYYMSDSLVMVSSFPYRDSKINMEITFLEKEGALSREVGRIEMVEEGDHSSGIYIPMLYGSSISIGDTIELAIGSGSVSYTVCGYFNSVMAGSHNCALMEFLLTEDLYDELAEQGFAANGTLFSVRIDDKFQSERFEAYLNSAVSSEYPDVLTLSNNYEMVSTSRYISQMICSAMVVAMAFFVTLIAVVVISSNVINYIQENMKNLGVLKATGYRSGQIIFALLLQFAGISFIVAAVGIALSYLLFPAVNDMMIAQTGIPYEMSFLPLPALITVAFIVGAVGLAVWASARRVKKIEPIVALRSGLQTHNFRKNRIPLDKTHASLSLALALKNTLSGIKQNVTVCVTMPVLSLVVVFSGVMTENVIMDIHAYIELMVGETADSAININAAAEDDFLQAMTADKRVEKIYLYNSNNVRTDGVELMATMSEDFSKANNQHVCFNGRFPKYDNEVAIAAKYARENGFKVGDEITLSADGNDAVYIITGYTQITNNLGKDCLLTRAGYERIGELQNMTYYMNLAEGTDVDEFNKEAAEKFGTDVNLTSNIMSVIAAATANVYVALMTVIVIAVIILSLIIITFVLYLLVRTMLNSKKRDHGIMKALGFTTGQLIMQTALSFMPAVIISTVIGIIGSAFVINPLLSVFLSGIGVVECSFTVPVGFIAVGGIGLTAFAFGMACLLSLRIRRIAPRALLVGE